MLAQHNTLDETQMYKLASATLTTSAIITPTASSSSTACSHTSHASTYYASRQQNTKQRFSLGHNRLLAKYDREIYANS